MTDHDDDLAHLAIELDRSGADERVAALEASARALSEHLGGAPVETSYVPIEIPPDATETDVVWPDGTHSTMRAGWTGSE
jgi:hypothetical protein